MAKGRPNLTIVTHAMTNKILFGKQAIGVEYIQGADQNNETRSMPIKKSVCAGAIASPQILQRSGVGQSTFLKSMDIEVIHDLPGVGENLQDHLEMCIYNINVNNLYRSTLHSNGITSQPLAQNGCF
jgi:choline dehydrogenase